MNLKEIYNKIEECRLDSPFPIFSSVNDAGINKDMDFNKFEYDKASIKIDKFFSNILGSKKYKKKLIYVSYIDDNYEYNSKDDYPWYQPNNIMVKAGISCINITNEKDIIIIKGGKYYFKETSIEKFKNIITYGDINFSNYTDIMYLQPFYLHINEEIIIYGHIDYSFGFIDITGKNGELMKELLKDFLKIEGLTWYANELGEKYIENNKIDIILRKED